MRIRNFHCSQLLKLPQHYFKRVPGTSFQKYDITRLESLHNLIIWQAFLSYVLMRNNHETREYTNTLMCRAIIE